MAAAKVVMYTVVRVATGMDAEDRVAMVCWVWRLISVRRGKNLPSKSGFHQYQPLDDDFDRHFEF